MINIDDNNPLLTSGAWVEFEGSEFLVTHMSNVSFQRSVMRKQAPYKSKIDKGSLDPEITRDLMSKAMSESLILDWRNVTDNSGAKIEFNPQLCYKALKNNEALRDFISSFAMDLDNFKGEAIDQLGKN
jgi:hypothetical protein